MNKRRIEDVKNNEIVENFLDRNIYPKLPYSITRNLGKEMNLKGVDILLNKDIDDLYVDEKIATRYINKSLKTFAFELSSVNNVDNNGWFLQNTYNISTHYLIGYLKGDLKNERIDGVELILLSKKKIWDYLNKNNFNIDYINSIRKNKVKPLNSHKGRDYYYTGIEDTKIVHSTYLKESPINIIIDKEKLIELSEKHIIYRNNKLNIM